MVVKVSLNNDLTSAYNIKKEKNGVDANWYARIGDESYANEVFL